MNLVQHRLQRFSGRRSNLDELRRSFSAAPVHAVQHLAAQVDVEVGCRAEALDQRDRAAVGLVRLQARLIEQEARDHAVQHLQHGRHQIGLRSQQQAQRDRQREHPLAQRHNGDDVVYQVRRRLRYATGTTRRAEPAPLATEGDQPVVAAVAAAQAQEAVGQDAGFEEGVELVLDELRQIGTGGGFGLGEEGRGVPLHQAVQRGLLGGGDARGERQHSAVPVRIARRFARSAGLGAGRQWAAPSGPTQALIAQPRRTVCRGLCSPGAPARGEDLPDSCGLTINSGKPQARTPCNKHLKNGA